MIANAGARFWVKAILAAVTGALGVLTLVWQEWIEAIFRVDPDGGDGSLEWAVVGVLFGATLTLILVARAEWRRRTAPV